MRTVLYVLHNHPSVMPGGAETYAVELFNAMKGSADYKPVLVARTGPPVSRGRRAHEGTLLESAGNGPDEYYFHTDLDEYDWFLSSSRNKASYTRYFRDLLTAYRPDVVHFQHTLFIGYDVLRETRRTLPDCKIVYTLHEYLPICHNSGQMMTTGGELCHQATPRRCNECFPDISPQQFFLRERFIKSHLGVVDMFVSPSQFLIDRYVSWGIPRDRIVLEPNGRTPVVRAGEAGATRARRDRIGYFGQFTAFKGSDVLLRAMQILAERRADEPGAPALPTLRLHGANIEHQTAEFQQLFADLMSAAGRNVTLVGRYRPADLPELMAAVDWVVVPSIWWENSPLVIQEAFAHGRPVICSDIGGMAEKVTDEVDGLHFRAGDALSLADTLTKAIETPGTWERLSAGIGEVHSIDAHAANLGALYNRLLAGSPAGSPSGSGPVRQSVVIGGGRVD
jgi:glycosyltransferase involved in cell wall biosynthesis